MAEPSRSSSSSISSCLLHHKQVWGYKHRPFPDDLSFCATISQLGMYIICSNLLPSVLTPTYSRVPPILDITGHKQTETGPVRETTDRFNFIFHEPFQKAMGKAFQPQFDVSISSKEKALWESQSDIVTETKTMNGFRKRLSNAVATRNLLPFMEGNKTSQLSPVGCYRAPILH